MTKRPTWDEYFQLIAYAVSRRSDCKRRHVGAVITKHNRIVSTGYNGAPAGEPGCEACPMREVGASDNYDRCVAVHAEANALLYADRDKTEGATLYVTREPCAGCAKLARAAGIARISYIEGTP